MKAAWNGGMTHALALRSILAKRYMPCVGSATNALSPTRIRSRWTLPSIKAQNAACAGVYAMENI